MKRLILFAIVFLIFTIQLFGQATITWTELTNQKIKTGTFSTTQIIDTANDTTSVFELEDHRKWSKAYISVFLVEPGDSCAVGLTLRGGYENDWDGTKWTAVDGPDTATTISSGINEIQYTIQTVDKAYPYWQIWIDGATDHEKDANTISGYIMIAYDWLTKW